MAIGTYSLGHVTINHPLVTGHSGHIPKPNTGSGLIWALVRSEGQACPWAGWPRMPSGWAAASFTRAPCSLVIIGARTAPESQHMSARECAALGVNESVRPRLVWTECGLRRGRQPGGGGHAPDPASLPGWGVEAPLPSPADSAHGFLGPCRGA